MTSCRYDVRAEARATDVLAGDIILWAGKIARIVSGLTFADFQDDEIKQLAVSKCVETIVEAAGLILKRQDELAAILSQLELIEAYRARSRLAHGYDTIDFAILWDTATVSTPRLANEVRRVLNRKD